MNEVACALDGCACRFPPWPDGLLAVLPVPVAVLLLLLRVLSGGGHRGRAIHPRHARARPSLRMKTVGKIS